MRIESLGVPLSGQPCAGTCVGAFVGDALGAAVGVYVMPIAVGALLGGSTGIGAGPTALAALNALPMHRNRTSVDMDIGTKHGASCRPGPEVCLLCS